MGGRVIPIKRAETLRKRRQPAIKLLRRAAPSATSGRSGVAFSHIFPTGGSEGGRLSAASAAVRSDIRPPPLLIWAGVFGDGSSHYTRPHLHAHAERGADTAGPEPSERTACEDTEGRLLWAQQKRWHRQSGDVYSKQKKKRKRRKMINGTKSKVSRVHKLFLL